MQIHKIAFGGGCHWCTEAVFQSLRGVTKVEQGWVGSSGSHRELSEAVIVHFDTIKISLSTLISIHLHTHSSTSSHQLRKKYRSAVYVFDNEQSDLSKQIIIALQKDFDKSIITEVLPYVSFKTNKAKFLSYYYTNPKRQFCQRYINPKLQLLIENYSEHIDAKKLRFNKS